MSVSSTPISASTSMDWRWNWNRKPWFSPQTNSGTNKANKMDMTSKLVSLCVYIYIHIYTHTLVFCIFNFNHIHLGISDIKLTIDGPSRPPPWTPPCQTAAPLVRPRGSPSVALGRATLAAFHGEIKGTDGGNKWRNPLSTKVHSWAKSHWIGRFSKIFQPRSWLPEVVMRINYGLNMMIYSLIISNYHAKKRPTIIKPAPSWICIPLSGEEPHHKRKKNVVDGIYPKRYPNRIWTWHKLSFNPLYWLMVDDDNP